MTSLATLRLATFWSVIGRVSARGMLFVQLFVLARYLTQEQFGVYAAASLTAMLAQTLTDGGFEQAIIQDQRDPEYHRDTLFVVRVVRGLLVGGILVAGAWPISHLLGMDSHVWLFVAVGVTSLLVGFVNPAVVEFSKNLDLKSEFYYLTLGTFAGTIVSIVTGILWRTEWAIWYGLFVTQIVQIAVSYMLRPYWPRFRIRRDSLSHIAGFGKWVWASRITAYFCFNLPFWTVAFMFGAAGLGLLQVASRLSQGIIDEINRIVTAVAFPSYAAAQSDLSRLRHLFLNSVRLLTVLTLPLYVFLICAAQRTIDVALGVGRWDGAAPILILFSANGLFTALNARTEVLRALGATRVIWHMTTLRLLCTAVFVYPLSYYFGVTGAVASILPGTIAGSLTGLKPTLRMLNLTWSEFADTRSIALKAAAVMAVVVFGCDRLLPGGAIYLLLVGFAGCAAYAGTAYALDRRAGGVIFWSLLSLIQGRSKGRFGGENFAKDESI